MTSEPVENSRELNSIPPEHFVENGGYGHPRENESWCSCGWVYEHEDIWGQAATAHYLKANRPYWDGLKSEVDRLSDILDKIADTTTVPGWVRAASKTRNWPNV